METSGRLVPRELPIIGGHLALDFANTVDDPLGPARHDHAATYEALLRWAVRTAAIPPASAITLRRAATRRPTDAAATVEQAHALRVALNDTFGAFADGTGHAPQHWIRLRPFAAHAIAAATLDCADPNTARWTWPTTDDLSSVLHPIAAAAAELLTSDQLSRIKRCARCPWLFLDNSKNHSRRWCDMNDCGRAQKIERYLARRAAARPRTRPPR